MQSKIEVHLDNCLLEDRKIKGEHYERVNLYNLDGSCLDYTWSQWIMYYQEVIMHLLHRKTPLKSIPKDFHV